MMHSDSFFLRLQLPTEIRPDTAVDAWIHVHRTSIAVGGELLSVNSMSIDANCLSCWAELEALVLPCLVVIPYLLFIYL